ncbi:MAG: class I adenylate-forming enzyme family protein [Desertimonas sp.]
MHLPLLLEMVADVDGERVGVGRSAEGWSYARLLSAARQAARRIRRADAQAVAFVGLNSDTLPLLLFGGGLAGVPFAPVNYRLPDEQLRGVLARLAPALAVIDDDMVERASGIDGVEVVARSTFLDQLDEESDGPLDDVAVDEDEIAVLLFTSGTTGEPKAAVLRHRHLASYILTTVDMLAADPDEAQLVCVPPYHIAGISSILSSVFAGRRIVYLPAFDAADWVSWARDESITQAMVVPTMLDRILGEIETTGTSLPALRSVSYGGGRMPLATIERAMGTLSSVRWTNAYGLTETSSTIAVLTPEDHADAFASDEPAVRARLGSVGRPVPTVELEIRGDDGAAAGVGERGEIYVRGDQIAGEYLGRSLLTDDGWFPTNDAGYVDAEGYLYLDGRLDDVIVRGAENLSPGEIEDVLIAHPAVAEAAVVGVPDATWGEKVVAAVVLADGAGADEAELQDWVRTRLRSTKTPERIDMRAELPHNETGKLLRRVLKQELAD